MISNILLNKVKYKFNKYFLSNFSNYLLAYDGLTKVPSSPKAIISDLFLWRKDTVWTTFFELLNINYLINPNDYNSSESYAKLLFFNQLGEKFLEQDISYSNEGRNTINISNLIPDNLNGFGTFSCIHLSNNLNIIENNSFIAERGYCGYSRNDSICKSYVHGNLDAISYDKSDIEMLGNYNKRTYFYNLQYEFKAGINYDIVLTNPTNNNQNITLNFINNNSFDQVYNIKPRGSIVKNIFFTNNLKVKLIIKSNIYMARPIIFRYHENSLDVFHG